MSAFIDVAFRVIHIVSAILVVGGLAFVPIAVRPALRLLDDGLRDSVLALVEKRLKLWLWIGVVGLIGSGIYNWIGNAGTYKAMGPIGNALIGTKVLLAAIIFALMWVRQSGMLGPRADRPLMMVIVHVAAIVIILASVLRYLRLEQLTGAGA